MNIHAMRAIYVFEMARTWRTHHGQHHLTGDLHVALFRGVRRGDRLADSRSEWRQLWRVHRAGPRHAVRS